MILINLTKITLSGDVCQCCNRCIPHSCGHHRRPRLCLGLEHKWSARAGLALCKSRAHRARARQILFGQLASACYCGGCVRIRLYHSAHSQRRTFCLWQQQQRTAWAGRSAFAGRAGGSICPQSARSSGNAHAHSCSLHWLAVATENRASVRNGSDWIISLFTDSVCQGGGRTGTHRWNHRSWSNYGVGE